MNAKSLAERFGEVYTGAITGVLDRRGYLQQTLTSDLAPLRPGMRLAGPAFPIEGRPHPEHDYDASIRKILDMLWPFHLATLLCTGRTTPALRILASSP